MILSDGDRYLDLAGRDTFPNGVWMAEWTPPISERERTYAESADSEGRRTIRERVQNATFSVKVYVGGVDGTEMWDAFDELQELIESVTATKGSTLRYVPPLSGTPITFELEGCRLSEVPLREVHLLARHIEVTIEFESRPYGLLEPVTIFEGVSLSGPIDSTDISGVPGHVDALAELTLTDASSQKRDHIEVALQTDYDPSDPEPLLIDGDTLVIDGFAGQANTRSGSYSTNIVRAIIAQTPISICSTGAQPHKGRWKIRLRPYLTATDIRVRLAWRVGKGTFTRERWVNIAAQDDWYDMDLETIDIAEIPSGTHSWEGYIEAYAASGVPTFDVDMMELLPA